MADNPTSPAGGSHESGGEQSPHSGVREQDRYLPIANISRIMKKALPANGKIAKDAKDTVQECVSEFISFITSELVLRASIPTLVWIFLTIERCSFWKVALFEKWAFVFWNVIGAFDTRVGLSKTEVLVDLLCSWSLVFLKEGFCLVVWLLVEMLLFSKMGSLFWKFCSFFFFPE